MDRAILFVDGFNLYHALMDVPAYRAYRWLDLRKLGESLLSSRQTLEGVFFFTAFYPGKPDKRLRHQHLIRAQELRGVVTKLGQFRRKTKHCPRCNSTVNGYEEKETDVNIAIEILRQAVNDRYDTACILSGDSDLLPAIRAVKDIFPEKHIRLIIPPRRRAEALKAEVHSYMQLKEHHLRDNQFPDLLSVKGVTLRKPREWR